MTDKQQALLLAFMREIARENGERIVPDHMAGGSIS